MLVGGVPTRCPHHVPRPGAPTMSGANFFVPPTSSLKINQWSIFKKRISRRGAILMKMAVFFIENAFCVGLFQSFYDGGDLDENGCFLFWKCVLRWTFSIILWWGRSWWKWLFSLSKTRFALDFFTHFSMGAILMKMAVFLGKMRFALDLSIILRWGRSWWKWFCVGLL